MPTNFKASEDNSIKRNLKPKPGVSSDSRCRNDRNKNCKCKGLKDRPDKESKDKKSNRSEWKNSSDS